MWNLTVILTIIWVLTLLYGEWFTYLLPSLWTCSWPHLHPSNDSSDSLNGINHTSSYVKIAVIADPQLMDKTSHNLPPKSLLLEISQFYTDLYMRRAFLSSIMPFDPDAILFLGDYFDGGFELSDEEWQESMRRLKHIFSLNTMEKSSNVQVHYISGNHDIGYAAFNSRKPKIISRYEREFGVRDFKLMLGGVDFIAVDSQTLDGLPLGTLTSTSWDFIRNVSKENDSAPKVLLTHIPLYRPDWTSCGPHRFSPVINQRIQHAGQNQEITYQNYVTKKSSDDLLDLIKPALVLSGHDHDQCTVTHNSKHGPVNEHTVGTVSWQQGNLYPSFMLLSVRNSTLSDGEDVISTQLCFLPMQTYIYIWYLSLLAMTLVAIFIWPANENVIFRKLDDIATSIKSLISFSSTTKEKNEDENCEYEEIWDAEGSMHLIKIASKRIPISNDKSSTERGNAVIRQNARKQIDMLSPDVSIQMESDGMVRLPVRAIKSRTKVIIWRVIKALRAIIIIAAVNVPLYILLLFKDWIDK